jgi:hypothetical protein
MSDEKTTPENTTPEGDDTEVEAHAADNVLGLQKLKAENGSAPGMVAPGSTGSCGAASCL